VQHPLEGRGVGIGQGRWGGRSQIGNAMSLSEGDHMEIEEEVLMAASRKRRQGSRFLGRRLVSSNSVSGGF